MWDRLLVDCNIATMTGDGLGVVTNGAIGIADGKIVRVGKRTELAGFRAREVTALGGAWVTPGLIDCHTHLIFGGNRADEHAMRRAGATYEQIAKAGGGIASTVKKTSAASDDALLASARGRLRRARGGRVHDSRGQDWLWPRRRQRAAAAPARRATRRRAVGPNRAHPARASRHSRRPEGPPCPLSGRDHRQAHPRRRENRGDADRRRLLRHHRLYPRRSGAAVQGRRRARPPGPPSRRAIVEPERAPRSPPNIARSPPTILNISTKRGPRRWRPPGRLRCCCRAPSTRSRKRRSRRSTCCASTRCRWRSRPIATPAPRRCCRRLWRSTWPAPCSA